MGSADVAQGSTGTPDADDTEVPGWYFWASDAGTPYATRSPASLTAEQERAGCEMTLAGNDWADLRRKIRNQPDHKPAASADAGVED